VRTDITVRWKNGLPTRHCDEKQGAEDGPEAIGAVADGVAKGEKFTEGQDGDDASGEGDGPVGSEEHDADNDGDEDKCSENARSGHSVGIKG
jgi:hypothetical protein